MKAVILAGGGGTRLWPVSRRRNPKQVEAIIGERSLLQATYDRVRRGFAPEDIIVSTSREHAPLVAAQLPELPTANLVAEPCRRDTASAIALALLHAAAHDPSEIFVTVNSDAYVRDESEYHRIIRAAGRAAAERPDHVILVGIKPAYPETGYGYIKTGGESLVLESDGRTDRVVAVERFIEKPDKDTAAEYVAHGGYLWNPTLIVGRCDTFLSLYDRHMPEHAAILSKIAAALRGGEGERGRGEVDRLFEKLSATLPDGRPASVDYGILEKERKLLALPADFGWADVGNWRAVQDIVSSGDANVVKGSHVGVDSRGNLIYNFSGKLVATAGVSGMIIVATDDALLICPRERAQDVKKIVAELSEKQSLRQYL